MANIFYAWEFGANLGHIGAFLPLARALRNRGHQVRFCVTSTASAAKLLAGEFEWLQAPICPEQPRQGPPLSYSDILLRFGYADHLNLLGLVTAWRELMQTTGAKVVLADHAPTAQLAARTLGLPVVLFGSGFYIPPKRIPTPNMRPWLSIPEEQFINIDKLATETVNMILNRFCKPTIQGIAQLFDVAEDTQLGFPELDHYENRGDARYWGNLPDAGVGSPPEWPSIPGKRIFVYLRQETRHHELALQALKVLRQPSLIFFPGIPADLRIRYGDAHMAYVDSPVDLVRAGLEADAAITYASLATTTRFLLAGKPLLLLPGHLEQFLMSRRVEQMGAGLLVDPEKPAQDLLQKLQAVVFNPLFADQARVFARKYAAFPQEVVVNNLVRIVEELVA